MPSLSRMFVPVLVAAAAVLVFAPRADSCSICRCSDPTFNVLGSEFYARPHLGFGLEWERFEKGAAHGAESNLTLDENRFTATTSYKFNDRLSAVLRVPFSTRRLEVVEAAAAGKAGSAGSIAHHDVGAGTWTANNLADPEVYILGQIWSGGWRPGLGRKAFASAFGGVKTPWGRNNLQWNGERLSEHLQPGTGATDAFAGLSMLYAVDPETACFVSTQVRRTGTNESGFRHGRSAFVNTAVERKMNGRVDLVLGADYRFAWRDRSADEGLDGDSGGQVLYLTPRALVGLGGGLVARAGAQIPVAERLNGVQDENPVLNIGFTYIR